jgi:hypothetical protein
MTSSIPILVSSQGSVREFLTRRIEAWMSPWAARLTRALSTMPGELSKARRMSRTAASRSAWSANRLGSRMRARSLSAAGTNSVLPSRWYRLRWYTALTSASSTAGSRRGGS